MVLTYLHNRYKNIAIWTAKSAKKNYNLTLGSLICPCNMDF